MRFWAHCDALSSISVVCRAIHCYPPQVLSARRHFPQKMPSLSAKAADNAGVDLKRNTFVCVLWRKTSRPQFRLMSAIDCDVFCLTVLRHGNAWTCAQVVCRSTRTNLQRAVSFCIHFFRNHSLLSCQTCSATQRAQLLFHVSPVYATPETFASYALPRRQLSLLSVLKTPHSGNFTCCKKKPLMFPSRWDAITLHAREIHSKRLSVGLCRPPHVVSVRCLTMARVLVLQTDVYSPSELVG